MSAGPRGGSVTTLARVREVFAGEGFRRLLSARIVSQLGDGVFQLAAAAVLLFEHPSPNPALDLLGITAVTLVPFSVIGPFTGVFIDRWDRSKILVRIPLIRAGVAALLPAAALTGTHGAAFYGVVLFVLSANRFFLATMSAVLPDLVAPDDLLVANSAATTGGAIANVSGQGVGSALSAVFGGERASLAAAVAFAATALATRRIAVGPGHAHTHGALGEELRGVVSEMVAGARAVRRSRRAVYALAAIGVVQLLVGAMVGVLTYFFIAVLHYKVGSAAGILAVLAVGIGVGVVLVPVAARRIRYDLLIPASFVIGALTTAFAAATVNRTSLIVGAGFVGIAYAFAKIPVDTIVQEEMAGLVRGRAFALYDMLFNVARVAGVAGVALAYERGAGSADIVWGISVAYLAATAAFVLLEGRSDMRFTRKRKLAQPADVLVPGEIVTVRAYAGARADEEPRAIVVAGRELAIDAIDWRAVVEEGGRRARVFVVRVGGRRVRLAHREAEGWEIERVMPLPVGLSENGPD